MLIAFGPGTRDMLQHAAEKATLAVLTNKPGAASTQILEGTGLIGFFDQLVAGDGRWARKPSPQGLQWLVGQAGETPASTLMVGDSIVDLHTARAAGVPICLAHYGFGFDTVPLAEITTEDWVIDRPAQLLQLLEPR